MTRQTEPAHVPDNLRIYFTESDEETAKVVRKTFAEHRQLVLVECCTGQSSPNTKKLLQGQTGLPKWTTVDDNGFFIAGDEDGKLSKALRGERPDREPGDWCDPVWKLIGKERPFVLSIDHHGDRSNEPCALRQTYQEHFGCLYGVPNPALLISRGIDEDLVSSALAAVGALPHAFFYDAIFDSLADTARDIVTRPFSDIIDIVEMVDIDPNMAPKLLGTWQGRELLAWRESLDTRFRDQWSAVSAIDAFRRIFISRRNKQREWDAVKSRLQRIESVSSVPSQTFADGRIIAADLTGFDANSAFYEQLTQEHEFAVVLLGNFFSGQGRITFVARDIDTAERSLGEGGLANFYPKIPGAGGRPNIGGAAWSGMYSFDDDAVGFANLLAESLKN